ncbi:MAG: molybdopterin biosynthesis protein [Candidatus Methanomethylicus sp.]|nr:molybdopterin biosynthesis protein [Candidatus Methanomethylicus sp.]
MTKTASRKLFHKLETIEEARNLLIKSAPVTSITEMVGLAMAEGRVLAESIFSSVDLPPFDRAEMDGFALTSSDTERASDQQPIELKFVGSVAAGDSELTELHAGECIEIATGAPMPRGADSVVMVEYTSRAGNVVNIFRATTPGENVASAGSDIQIGEMALREGAILGTREIAILAAIGRADVPVIAMPIVGIISTGNELAEAGSELSYGKIYDVNSSALIAAVGTCGCKPRYYGRAADNYENMESMIKNAIQECDLLLISGGTSAGDSDLVYRVLGESFEPGIVIHGLQVKPGKPTIIAYDGTKPIVGLPGYPVSALIIFDQLVKPFLYRVGRRQLNDGVIVEGSLSQRVNGAKGKRWYLPVHAVQNDGKYGIYPVIASSGAIGTLAKADGYITVNSDSEFIDRGQSVRVRMFEGYTKADLTVMGSHCPGLDLLLLQLFKERGLRAKTANIGSLGGLNAVAQGQTDIAGIHLLDENSMKYNLSFIEEAGFPLNCLIKGYKRLQGIMVRKGNPLNIENMEDLLGKDLIFVNRNRGSGTRILTDSLLKGIAFSRGLDFNNIAMKIRGYRWEAKTHSAVGAAISQGRADAGVGVRSVAAAYNLDFIPLSEEEYDFVINPMSLEKESVKLFKEQLRSEKFRKALEKLPGYTLW